MSMVRKAFLVRLPPEWFPRIDAARGIMSRNAWMTALIGVELDAVDEDRAVPLEELAADTHTFEAPMLAELEPSPSPEVESPRDDAPRTTPEHEEMLSGQPSEDQSSADDSTATDELPKGPDTTSSSLSSDASPDLTALADVDLVPGDEIDWDARLA